MPALTELKEEPIAPELNISEVEPIHLSDIDFSDNDGGGLSDDEVVDVDGGGLSDDEVVDVEVVDNEGVGLSDDEVVDDEVVDDEGGGLSDDEVVDDEGGGLSDDEDEASDDDELQKIDREDVNKYIIDNHPERIVHNREEIEALSKVFRNKDGVIEDVFHKTIPFITRFEKARILGMRARQLNRDPEQTLVSFDMGVIDGYNIALEEYKQKLIPFIIKRPLPDGSCEYWKFEDLEQIE